MTLQILTAAYVAVAAAMLFFAFVSSRKFLYLTAFLLPLNTFTLETSVQITWYKLALPLAVVVAIVRRNSKTAEVPGNKRLALFIGYVVAVSVIAGVYDYMAGGSYRIGEVAGFGAAQAVYRYPVQTVSAILTLGLPFIGAWFVRGRKDLRAASFGFIAGNTVNVVTGFYQLAARGFGLPWFSGWFLLRHLDEGSFQLAGTDNYRLSGFGGEPKQAAAGFVLALALALSLGEDPVKHRISLKWLPIVLLLLAGVILSYSTGALLGTGLVICYFGIRRRWRWLMISGAAAAMLWLGISRYMGYEQDVGGVQSDMLASRFGSGLDGLYYYEPRDVAFVEFALEGHPQLLFGYGAGGIDFQILKYAPVTWLRGGASGITTFTPAYVPNRMIGDFGLIGFSLLISVMAAWAAGMRGVGLHEYGDYVIAAGAACMVTSASGLPGYLLICGCAAGYAGRLLAERRAVRRLRLRIWRQNRDAGELQTVPDVAQA